MNGRPDVLVLLRKMVDDLRLEPDGVTARAADEIERLRGEIVILISLLAEVDRCWHDPYCPDGVTGLALRDRVRAVVLGSRESAP